MKKELRKRADLVVLLLRESPEDPRWERPLQNWTKLCKLKSVSPELHLKKNKDS